jgi:hypothetical protein
MWRSGGKAPPFLTSALDGGEWSASGPGHFTPGETPQVPTGLDRRVGGPQSRSGAMEKRKFLAPTGNRTPAVQLSGHADWRTWTLYTHSFRVPVQRRYNNDGLKLLQPRKQTFHWQSIQNATILLPWQTRERQADLCSNVILALQQMHSSAGYRIAHHSNKTNHTRVGIYSRALNPVEKQLERNDQAYKPQ